MGKVFVELNNGKIQGEPANKVIGVYDSANNNVPAGAVEITAEEFKEISYGGYEIGDYEVNSGVVQLSADAVLRMVESRFNNIPKELRLVFDELLALVNECRGSLQTPQPVLTLDEVFAKAKIKSVS